MGALSARQARGASVLCGLFVLASGNSLFGVFNLWARQFFFGMLRCLVLSAVRLRDFGGYFSLWFVGRRWGGGGVWIGNI